ncbi:MAG: hypothetical protein P0Y53_16050 [Candidatus Pseudobacter hemicellulosilyticus]|uniref:Metal-dependent HD superfamily phosphohydrolase n=1 Tax=Candidatus Pseudobacter hemicellulosilyticus TaxID=3121375 RepID=A0AAJ5WLA8_9BACT|nr:MAG: hypothetical protein P0Y53_16050 [Pseudobacter sp.]
MIAVDPWLQEKWTGLMTAYKADPALADKCLHELFRKYSSSGRHYHTLVHIRTLLDYADAFRSSLADLQLVTAAILYHDIIYNVWRTDNEARSAALAGKRFKDLKVSAAVAEKLQLYIDATHLHCLPPALTGDQDAAFFLDFDMAILGASWPEYLNYIRQVRKEYHIYPEMLYKSGRRKFLQNSLRAPVLFHTPEFRQSHEAQARANMEKELELLLSADFSL